MVIHSTVCQFWILSRTKWPGTTQWVLSVIWPVIKWKAKNFSGHVKMWAKKLFIGQCPWDSSPASMCGVPMTVVLWLGMSFLSPRQMSVVLLQCTPVWEFQHHIIFVPCSKLSKESNSTLATTKLHRPLRQSHSISQKKILESEAGFEAMRCCIIVLSAYCKFINRFDMSTDTTSIDLNIYECLRSTRCRIRGMVHEKVMVPRQGKDGINQSNALQWDPHELHHFSSNFFHRRLKFTPLLKWRQLFRARFSPPPKWTRQLDVRRSIRFWLNSADKFSIFFVAEVDSNSYFLPRFSPFPACSSFSSQVWKCAFKLATVWRAQLVGHRESWEDRCKCWIHASLFKLLRGRLSTCFQ